MDLCRRWYPAWLRRRDNRWRWHPNQRRRRRCCLRLGRLRLVQTLVQQFQLGRQQAQLLLQPRLSLLEQFQFRTFLLIHKRMHPVRAEHLSSFMAASLPGYTRKVLIEKDVSTIVFDNGPKIK